MQTVYAGTYIAQHIVQDGNDAIVHVCTSEAALVEALLRDIGDTMGGITCTSLVELCELLQQYCEAPYDHVAYNISTI